MYFRQNKATIIGTALLGAFALSVSHANAACTFGSSSGEPSLQTSFNQMLGANALSATSACLDDGDDAGWGTIGSIGQLDVVLELAGNAQTNTFGIYDLKNPNVRLSVFDGADSVGSQAMLRLRQTTRGWRVSVQDLGGGGWSHQYISSNAFGFYLATRNQGTFFSQSARNGDGVDHMYAYQGTGTAFRGGPLAGEVFTPQDYLLAWEDLAGGGDRDYQDFIAVVQDIAPVPLPTPVLLLMSGLIGLAGVSRRPT